ncbi:hypothetical protein HID58_005712 [Brassica napus]|uniref:RING-type domain-containing protein n=1 Tax=Brassica napus TaxID=3708 RepID=A0ABQ8E9B7_BRANA|nr:hypothetical protein HID58_005712 [Brassica napus]
MGSCLSSPSSSSTLPRTRTVDYKVNYIARPTRTKQQVRAKPSTKLCLICMDEKSPSDIFRGTTSCTHSYCTECTVRYVTTKVEENAARARIKCPDMNCTQLIEPYTKCTVRSKNARLVPWHAGSGCKETKKKKTRNSDKEDALLIDLAKKKKWRRSGALNANSTLRKPLVSTHFHYILRSVIVKCGFQFCYRCGSPSINLHHSCGVGSTSSTPW